MAYSKNPYTLRKIEAHLAPLIVGRTVRWHRPTGEDERWASRWAYKVREGLSIAQRFPDSFPQLAIIAPLVKVEVLSPILVEAYMVAAVPQPMASSLASVRAVSFDDEVL